MNNSIKPIVAASTTGILVGAAMVSTRYVSHSASSETLAFLRYLIGVCFLLVPLGLGKFCRFAAKDALVIGILGILQFGVLIVLLNYALVALSATTCALIFSTMPLLTLGLAVLSRQETYRHLKLAGIILAALGISILLTKHSTTILIPAIPGPALACVFGATIIGAACSILYRPYLLRYRTLPTSALAMCAAVVALAFLCLFMDEPLFPGLSTTEWANVGFIGLSSGMGYFCLLWALSKMSASRVVAFQALGPVTAATIEMFISRQYPSWELLLSISLVLCGLHLALQEGAISNKKDRLTE